MGTHETLAPAVLDLVAVCERHYDEVFANRRESASDSRDRFLRAARGDFSGYEPELRERARAWARKKLSFQEWFDANRSYMRALGEHVARDFASEPARLIAAFEELQRFSDRVLAILGAAFVDEKSEALRLSEEHYRLLFESSPFPMWVFDSETLRFLAVNEAAVRLYGWTADEFLSMTIKEIRPAEDLARLESDLADPPRTDLGKSWRHRRKDGRVFPVEVKAHAFVFNGRNARLVLAWDVTERRNLELQLRQSQKMEAIGKLAGGVAHDFNNLLTVILSYSASLLGTLAADDAHRHDVEEIQRAGERAADLTRQLLAFGRQQVLEPRLVALNTIVEGFRGMLARLIGEDIQVLSQCAPDLDLVRVDPGQVEQILLNLVVNARDAMPDGGKLVIETANIELDEEYANAHLGVKAGRHVMLAVSDNGVGMDAATQARIFEPFFTTKGAGKGTGLGLSTVMGAVEQSGGNIWLYSELGRGTTFKVYFPCASKIAETAAPAKKRTERPGGGTETILLVEDDAQVRKIVNRILARAGYRVLEATSGDEAIAAAKANEAIALLLTDLVMPQMSGRELATKITAIRPALRVLYMSGYTDDAVVRTGILEEGMPFIQKPLSPAGLAQKIRDVLDA